MDLRAAACILVTVASVGAASAHHGWGSYDATKVFTINAPVETLTWADPHTHITLKYQGNVWEATLAPLFRMQARGLTEEMLKPAPWCPSWVIRRRRRNARCGPSGSRSRA